MVEMDYIDDHIENVWRVITDSGLQICRPAMRLDHFFLETVLLLLVPLNIGASFHDGWPSLSRRANEPSHKPAKEQNLGERQRRAELNRRYMDLDYEQTFRYEACAKMLEVRSLLCSVSMSNKDGH